MITAYFLWSKQCGSREEAMNLFGSRRTANAKVGTAAVDPESSQAIFLSLFPLSGWLKISPVGYHNSFAAPLCQVF